MKCLGVIEDVSYRGMLIVRSSFAPRTGTGVMSRRSVPLGRVAGVVGPVENPFVLVEPLRDGGKGANLVGTAVYIE